MGGVVRHGAIHVGSDGGGGGSGGSGNRHRNGRRGHCTGGQSRGRDTAPVEYDGRRG